MYRFVLAAGLLFGLVGISTAQSDAVRLLELERVLARDPHDAAARQERSELRARMGSLDNDRFRALVALELGYDSNFNSGTDASEVALPLLRVTPTRFQEIVRDLRGREDSFIGMHGAAQGALPIGAGWQVRLAGAAYARKYREEDEWLPNGYRVGGELEWRLRALALRAGAWALERRLGRETLLESRTLSAALDAGNAPWILTLAASRSDKTYPLFDELRTREEELGMAVSPLGGLTLALAAGRERARGTLRELDRDFESFEARWSRRVDERSALQLAYHETESRYLPWSQLFLANRVESLREVRVAWDRAIARGWYFTPKAVLQDNRSNIPLTRFSRSQWLVELRKEF